jgi:hypothetical protein
MPPVAGATVRLRDLFFLRRIKKHASNPMMARPRIGPTTAPAIHALLLLLRLVPKLEDDPPTGSLSGLSVGTLVGMSDARPGKENDAERVPMAYISKIALYRHGDTHTYGRRCLCCSHRSGTIVSPVQRRYTADNIDFGVGVALVLKHVCGVTERKGSICGGSPD